MLVCSGNVNLVTLVSGFNGQVLNFFGDVIVGPGIGKYVAVIDDINGDSTKEILFGAPHADAPHQGAVYIVGNLTGPPFDTLVGDTANDNFGLSVSYAGDVDNDGIEDFIVGGARHAWVFSGLNRSELYKLDGDYSFGWSVSGIGDYDNDNFDDFAIGVPYLAGGRLFSFSGQSGDTLNSIHNGFTHMYIDSIYYNSQNLGWYVTSFGDVNGDGYSDFVVATTYYRFQDNSYPFAFHVFLACGNRGDVNCDGRDANILDLNYLVNYMFRFGPAPECNIEADMNSDGSLPNTLDLLHITNRIFRFGPSPGPCY